MFDANKLAERLRSQPNVIDSSNPKISILERLTNTITETNLVDTMTIKIGDELVKYKDEEGQINALKIPQNLYIVAIIYEIIEAAKKINLGIAVKHGVIYVYNEKYWEEIEDEGFKKILSTLSEKMGFYSPLVARTSEFKEKLFKQLMNTGIDEAATPKSKNVILINLNNGTLEIDKHNVKLRQHDREDFLTYALDYDYEPTALSPIFSKFLTEVLPEQGSRDVLQEFMGYVFTTAMKLEKVAVLYGSGANGKSVFFETITALMGKNNISHKGLGDLCMKGDKGNNHRAEVENKLLNFASEVNPKGADVDIFKAFTSNEPVDARRLFKDVYTYRGGAKLVFNANKLPTETEKTEAYFRRFLIIPFDVTIPPEKQDIHLHSKITDNELSGVMNWAIDGLKRLLINNAFSYSKKMKEALEAYKKESNNTIQFVEEYNLIKNQYEFTSNEDLYNTYTEFCNSNGYKGRFSSGNFYKELVLLGFNKDSKTIGKITKRGFKIEFGG